jgi:hypothetical protein
MKFLIDECLSLKLVDLAVERRYVQSSHVVRLGKSGWKDWELTPFILDGDWTFVTKNSIDFRGKADNPGAKGQYSSVPIHAGLVCLNGPEGMDRALQLDLFEIALVELDRDPDIINQVIEVTLAANDEIQVLRYDLPPE